MHLACPITDEKTGQACAIAHVSACRSPQYFRAGILLQTGCIQIDDDELRLRQP